MVVEGCRMMNLGRSVVGKMKIRPVNGPAEKLSLRPQQHKLGSLSPFTQQHTPPFPYDAPPNQQTPLSPHETHAGHRPAPNSNLPSHPAPRTDQQSRLQAQQETAEERARKKQKQQTREREGCRREGERACRRSERDSHNCGKVRLPRKSIPSKVMTGRRARPKISETNHMDAVGMACAAPRRRGWVLVK